MPRLRDPQPMSKRLRRAWLADNTVSMKLKPGNLTNHIQGKIEHVSPTGVLVKIDGWTVPVEQIEDLLVFA